MLINQVQTDAFADVDEMLIAVLNTIPDPDPGIPKKQPEIEPEKLPDEDPGLQPDTKPKKEDDDDDDDDDDDYTPYTEPEIGDDPGKERIKVPIM